MKPTVFIHTSSHEILSAKVAEFSHLFFAKNPDEFNIKVVRIEDYPNFTRHHGETIIRFGKEAAWYKDVPQSFLPLRFIVPQLMQFEGRAVLTDPDIFAVSDIWELLEKDMQGKSILSRRFGNRIGDFNSSVMLLDCEKLSHWKWDEMIESIFRKEVDFQDLITLRIEPEGTIGELEEEWNHYDQLNEKTKLLHNTRQITQPWKTGLPFKQDNMNNYHKKKDKNAIEKIIASKGKGKRKLLSAIKNTLIYSEPLLYKKNPDPRQEKFFLSLLKEALKEGFIGENIVKSEIRLGHIRRDIFRVLKLVDESPVEIKNRIKYESEEKLLSVK